ncbi:anthranilate synthase component I family protein [Sunxiuqinia elliptica]|uniref:Anthranilate synthase component 1 n=1 Tax=Sunxiuqinia elliptica TaxID=655355 RepID=A0A4R6H6U9_9BACT|nr:anthranilate synthase component I family protein [Sunxiuqinia elliptica]TDO03930.1 anthranilate synthase component 1 [Sunxiuqinia elliptica]TDO62212.1 anthranilate synthase component 1 [Sunxiuqinia elliptica]
MKPINVQVNVRKILADTLTPVSVYLKFRELFPNSILLESSDYHGNENAYSFICIKPLACFTADQGLITTELQGKQLAQKEVADHHTVAAELDTFFKSFKLTGDVEEAPANGLFGYLTFDSIQYFEKIDITATRHEAYAIPEAKYCFYKYILAIDHSKDVISLIENLPEGEPAEMGQISSLLKNLSFPDTHFDLVGEERSNITDEAYRQMVIKGKEHCFRGDVFQIVLSRQFAQQYKGDEFNVYRALRSVNPSPYLFFFDYGDFRIFGSSPEAQLRIKNERAIINPIAGTFRRTGNDEQDRVLAEKLCADPKENAEHVMLVDLARNDLSRNAAEVVVDSYREVQYFSHVIHLVSEVSGKLPEEANMVSVLGDSFPAGTLSGAPKHMAMQLIDRYENQRRSYYGGAIGFLGFDNSLNHAIMIRSFLSKGETLYYQAGAGVVADSVEENELQEVNNKLAALKKAIELAREI